MALCAISIGQNKEGKTELLSCTEIHYVFSEKVTFVTLEFLVEFSVSIHQFFIALHGEIIVQEKEIEKRVKKRIRRTNG